MEKKIKPVQLNKVLNEQCILEQDNILDQRWVRISHHTMHINHISTERRGGDKQKQPDWLQLTCSSSGHGLMHWQPVIGQNSSNDTLIWFAGCPDRFKLSLYRPGLDFLYYSSMETSSGKCISVYLWWLPVCHGSPNLDAVDFEAMYGEQKSSLQLL